MIQEDVPSPIDLKDMHDAQEWERTAMQRPFRGEFFSKFEQELASRGNPSLKILELGSGPGFLAQYVLSRHPDFDYTLLDFSHTMHELARHRLQQYNDGQIKFVVRSFKGQGWEQGLGEFDAVVTNQAVHELRHKRYALDFFRQVRSLIAPGGIFLVCDHYFGDGAMQNDQLFMSLAEQRESLSIAGFSTKEILIKGGRALYRAT